MSDLKTELSTVNCQPTTDIRTLTTKVLQEKLTLRTQQLCQNFELSAHLVDLVTREVQEIQKELYSRKNEDRRKWIFAQLAHLSELITVDAVMNSEYVYKHVKAQEFLNLMMNRAVNREDFADMLTKWLRFGGTALLRDKILPQLGYVNDYIPDFNVMVLLDDIGIEYRKNQEVRSMKAKVKRQEYREWRTPEVQYIKDKYASKKVRELSKEMGRSRNSILYMAYKLGLKKNKFTQISASGKQMHYRWTPEQEDFLRENYNKMTVEKLAEIMERSKDSIHYKATDLELKKDASFFRRKSKKKSPEGTAALAGSDVGFMITNLPSGLISPQRRKGAEEI